MCTQNQLQIITSAVAKEAKQKLRDRLDAVILYGSYARGDYDDQSDIDILVRIRCKHSELPAYRRTLTHCAGELSLEHGVTVSVQIADTESYDRYKTALPYYRNIEREGVTVA